jgi:hypothetical protein
VSGGVVVGVERMGLRLDGWMDGSIDVLLYDGLYETNWRGVWCLSSRAYDVGNRCGYLNELKSQAAHTDIVSCSIVASLLLCGATCI